MNYEYRWAIIWEVMLTHLKFILHHDCQLVVGKPLLVGVSGGPDSICLLDCLQCLGFPIIVAHFDHQLRPESKSDLEFVAAEAGRRRLKFVSGNSDVRSYAEEKHLSIEEAARQARYDFLFEQARSLEVQAVVVGHNADDQVETLLMHLLRGAGLSGLSGMKYRLLPNPWSEVIPLTRPLLSTWREEIESYLAERGLESCLDSTNQNRTYFRNRIRMELLPYLANYQPKVKSHLHRLASIIQGDLEVISTVEADAWRSIKKVSGPGFVGLDLELLKSQMVGLQRRLIRAAIGELRPELRDIDFHAVERVRSFLESPATGRRFDLVSGLCFMMSSRLLWVADWQAELPVSEWPQLIENRTFPLALPGSLELASGWRILAQIIDFNDRFLDELQANVNPYHAWFDMAELPAPLLVRPRQPGDRMHPLGMDGHTALLSDIMVNAKIPQHVRNRWPVIVTGDTIIWLPGLHRSIQATLTPDTQSILYISCQKSDIIKYTTD